MWQISETNEMYEKKKINIFISLKLLHRVRTNLRYTNLQSSQWLSVDEENYLLANNGHMTVSI